MAADVIALLDYLNITKVILVGHSMGGQVAGYTAALYPDYIQSLAILDMPASGPEHRSTLPPEQIPHLDPLTREWPLPFTSLKEAMTYIRQATDSELSYQYFMNSLTETVEGYQMLFSPQAMAANMAYNEDWYHLLPDIKCPTLLIRARNSEGVSDDVYVKMQSLLSDCSAFEMSHPDHNVHLGNPDEFYACFDRFLK
ncbi:N-formylmaleamate deformylase [compost metagenome]